MANGSFGLSGFPTGSSTTSGGATTPFTQKEITVTSVNGFSQGDLVYQYNNDFAPITSAASPGAAAFPVPTQKVTNAINGGTGGFQYLLPNRNNGNPRTMAKLSNGNIVWVYNKAIGTGTNHRPCFIVTDENNTVVVAETIIEATNLPTRDWGPVVCALSGGGFVVAWVNASNNLRYGVYTNAGAVTTALQNDTGVTIISTTTTNRLSIAPRPVSGGFVVAVLENSTNIIKHRVYGPTGTATYVWTTNNTGVSTSQIPRVAVRSDDTFVVVSTNNVANTFVYYLWSATNTAVSNSSFSATIAQNLGTDVIALTDNRYIFIVSTSTGFFFRTLTGSTLSGTSIALIPNTGTATSSVTAAPLSNGGWAVAWTIGSSFSASDLFNSELVFVNVYNSSNTLVSSTYRGTSSAYTGYPYNFIPGSACLNTHFSVLETSGYIHVLLDGVSVSAGLTMSWSRFSKTTFQIIPFTSSAYNTSAANTAALPTGEYAPLASSVTAAAFYPASTSTQGWSIPTPTEAQFIAASQVITTQTSVDYTQAVSLSNGNVVVAWSGYDTNSGVTLYSCKYMVFNGEGNIILLPTVLGAETTSSSNVVISMAAMPGGKFAIFYKGLYVLNASGKILASIATPLVIASSGSYPPSLSALTGDRLVLMYIESGPNLRFAVYDQNLTLLSGPTTLIASSIPNGFSVATLGSTLEFLYSNTSSQLPDKLEEWVETSANTWTLASTVSITQQNTYGIKTMGLSSGSVVNFYGSGGGSNVLRLITSAGEIRTWSMPVGVNSPNTSRSAIQIGCTGSGNIVVAGLQTSNTSFAVMYFYPNYSSMVSNFTVNHNSNGGNGFTPALASLCGEMMLMAYVSWVSGQKMVLNYSIFSMGTFQGTDIIPAGSTASRPIAPITNTTGYSLVGVATSSAAPGGTGTITVNGSATLNSNYFFAAPGQVFDFSNPVRFGVAGSVLERNVTLQGN
jgi:hypothetical protein